MPGREPDERLTRRDALRRLAFLPIKFYGLALGANISASSTEKVLVRCTAGIAACESLSNSADLATAFSAISAYLPILTTLLAISSRSQQAIARLTTQCLFLKTILSMHLEGTKQAMRYAQQAVEYSEKSGDLPLCITALGRQAWVNFETIECIWPGEKRVEHLRDLTIHW
jgi:hypothetical protein